MDRGESTGTGRWKILAPISLRDGNGEGLRDGELILICDIGGGTSDFSLVRARLVDGELQFERIAIGEHLLLGGDNLDFALAHHVEQMEESSKTSGSRYNSVMRYDGPAVPRKSGC